MDHHSNFPNKGRKIEPPPETSSKKYSIFMNSFLNYKDTFFIQIIYW